MWTAWPVCATSDLSTAVRSLQEFDTSGDGNPFMVVWGQVVLILYIAVVNILIMSLLIAVITHAYNPDSIKAHAIVMQAGSTLHYDFHGKAQQQQHHHQLLMCTHHNATDASYVCLSSVQSNCATNMLPAATVSVASCLPNIG